MTANLWEWNWNSIAKECSTLADLGYDGVQVAPPQNSVKRTELGNGSDTVLHPWWEVYQPVTYDLTSRMGNEAQFKSMVKACRREGVKVYVDAVINHMTGQGHTSYGGVDYTPYHYRGLRAERLPLQQTGLLLIATAASRTSTTRTRCSSATWSAWKTSPPRPTRCRGNSPAT